MFEWQERPHSRLNPLTGEWVLVSPQRTERPWQGKIEAQETAAPLRYDPDCYLCPGNPRAGGERNPQYTATFAFDNDFPALVPETPVARFDDAGLRVAESEPGVTRVLCFSPDHDLTLARMDTAAIEGVIDAWQHQNAELGGRAAINYVQIFENRGAMMGASNPHPHCQIWANHRRPDEIIKEQAGQEKWVAEHASCLLCDYLAREQQSEQGDRIVCSNGGFVTIVPFWAVWPYETLIIGRRHFPNLGDLTADERRDLAAILKETLTRYDNLFQSPCPYSMGFHQSPSDGQPHEAWHFHAHFYPPVLRSATVRKFMVGYELLAMPQRDITPELAAERLRSLSSVHYSSRAGNR
jgi:UDPglucose--hexose-1-phosphate uridylyltransferase